MSLDFFLANTPPSRISCYISVLTTLVKWYCIYCKLYS